jgi:hypothetical protein
MALNDITFNIGQGGLGRPLPAEDHKSGFIMPFTTANLPSGFSASDRIKKVLSVEEAEALGIAEGSATNGVLWYHINQYFRIQPQGELWIYLTDDTAQARTTEVEDLQTAANGAIRQVAYYDSAAVFATVVSTAVSELDTAAVNLQATHKPLVVLFTANAQAVADLTTLPDLRALAKKHVSVVIGEDGAGDGAALAISESKSITAIGACLGATSLAFVHENIGWVQKFNMSEGDALEFDEPAFSNGAATVLVKDTADTTLDQLNTRGYIFLRKHVGIDGSYFNDSPSSDLITSDFAYIENNRTIQKASRLIRTNLLPQLNSPLLVDADTGRLAESTINYFKNLAELGLESMSTDGEISGFSVDIDPTQNVLSTSQLEITVVIVPVGVARKIVVNLGFALSV